LEAGVRVALIDNLFFGVVTQPKLLPE